MVSFYSFEFSERLQKLFGGLAIAKAIAEHGLAAPDAPAAADDLLDDSEDVLLLHGEEGSLCGYRIDALG
jgi:hypothetical protein